VRRRDTAMYLSIKEGNKNRKSEKEGSKYSIEVLKKP
jgi:hypothetical protein